MISKTISIGARGQITLPKKLRDLFKTNSVTLEMIDDKHVVISPVENVAGGLAEYAKKTNLSFDEIRNKSWSESRK